MKTLQLFVFAMLISGNLFSQPAYWMFDWVVKKTPLNDSFSAGVLKYQYELDDIQATNTYWCQLYQNATLLGNSTRSYNCHAYAWHVKNGGGNVWISSPDDNKYWGTNGGYTEIGSAATGEIIRISYADDDHSAVGTDEWGTYVSKWGEGPLMSHSAADCPYTSSNRKYYWVPITGNILNCSSESYSTLSISGGSYSWTGSRVNISGSGSSITATKTSDGSGWIKVDITSPYSGTTVSSEQTIWLGAPIIDYIESESGEYGQPEIPYYFYTYPSNNSYSESTYTWDTNPWAEIWPQSNAADIVFYDPYYYEIMVEATNSCGSTDWIYTYMDIQEELFSISPNPASDETTVTVKMGQSGQTYTISVFDLTGILHTQIKFTGEKFTMPVYKLKDGNYIIKVNNGKKFFTKQLIVKH